MNRLETDRQTLITMLKQAVEQGTSPEMEITLLVNDDGECNDPETTFEEASSGRTIAQLGDNYLALAIQPSEMKIKEMLELFEGIKIAENGDISAPAKFEEYCYCAYDPVEFKDPIPELDV